MPIERMRIDQAIQRWITTFCTRSAAESTIKAKRIPSDALRRSASEHGTLYVRDLRRHHFDSAMADLAGGLGSTELARRAALATTYPSSAARRRIETYPTGGPRRGRSPVTLASDKRHLERFVEYCQANNWIAQSFRAFSADDDHILREDAPERGSAFDRRRIVRHNDWPRLLDVAEELHPRTRILVAMGLLWGRRVSEAAMMQWGHINPTTRAVDRDGLTLSYRAAEIGPGQAVVRNVKRRRTILIPIGAPMQDELERWQTWIEKFYGEVEPDWYVVPCRTPTRELPRCAKVPKSLRVGEPTRLREDWPIKPERPAGVLHLIRDVQRALAAFGWHNIKNEGMHTLRRSVASHLDHIGEIAAAQALLDHKHRSTTELYSLNRAGESDLNDLMLRPNPYADPRRTTRSDLR